MGYCAPHRNELLWGPSCSSLPALRQRVSPRAFQSSPSGVKCKTRACQPLSCLTPAAWGKFCCARAGRRAGARGAVANPVFPGFLAGGGCWHRASAGGGRSPPPADFCSLLQIYTFNLQWQSLAEILQYKHCGTEEAALNALTLLELGRTQRM